MIIFNRTAFNERYGYFLQTMYNREEEKKSPDKKYAIIQNEGFV